MTQPFDDPDASYVILVNATGARSLWPAWADVPSGWTVAFGPAPRADCLAYADDA